MAERDDCNFDGIVRRADGLPAMASAMDRKAFSFEPSSQQPLRDVAAAGDKERKDVFSDEKLESTSQKTTTTTLKTASLAQILRASNDTSSEEDDSSETDTPATGKIAPASVEQTTPLTSVTTESASEKASAESVDISTSAAFSSVIAESTTESASTPAPARLPTPPPEESENESFKTGCRLDVMIVLDASGSVEENFMREKMLAGDIVQRLRIGPNNARVSIVKFASPEKTRTMYAFTQPQSKRRVLRALANVPYHGGTTALHLALAHAASELSVASGARRDAVPVAFVFTDGFAQKDIEAAAAQLRTVAPNTYAIAVNSHLPISRAELARIAGQPERVFTDRDLDKLDLELASITRDCALVM